MAGLSACGTVDERAPLEGGAVFRVPPSHEGGEVFSNEEPAIPPSTNVPAASPTNTVPVTPNPQTPPPALPPAPGSVEELLVKINSNMGDYRPGVYYFTADITGGEAPLEVSWGCTSPDSKCPEMVSFFDSDGYSSRQGNFEVGHYQVDLSVRDAQGNKASDSVSFEIVVAPTGGGSSQPGNFQSNIPNDFEANLSGNPIRVQPTLSANLSAGTTEFSFNEVYESPTQVDWTDGVVGTLWVTGLSWLHRYQSPFTSGAASNRLEGEIRVRFARRSANVSNTSSGENRLRHVKFFPTDWIQWSLKGCRANGICSILIENLPVEAISTDPCNPDQSTQCERVVRIDLPESALNGETLASFEKFEILVQDTDESIYRNSDRQIQTCNLHSECGSSHPYCVAGLCSAVYPGTFLETN